VGPPLKESKIRLLQQRVCLALTILLAGLAPACGRAPSTPPGEALAWSQVRLATTEPTIIEPGGTPPGVRLADTSLGQAQPLPNRNWGGREINAVEMAVGASATWRLELGRDAYLSFIPLGLPGGAECEAEYVVRAGKAGTSVTPEGSGATAPDGSSRELHAEEAARAGRMAAARREIDLSSLSGSIDLTLAVRAGNAAAGCPAALRWGNPRVVSRTAPVAGSPGRGRPNFIVLGIDTLRADRLGRQRPGLASLTPAMDRLVAESDTWTRAFSTFNNTNPSFISIFTGLYGKNHGIYDLRTPLPEERRTLAEELDDGGYDTFAVIAARHLSPRISGLGQGFDTVVTPQRYFAAETVVDEAMAWLGGRGEEPFFTWLHFYDPHTPTMPPDPFAEGWTAAGLRGMAPGPRWDPFRPTGPRDFQERRLGGHPDLYDGEVAYLDRQIDRLLDFLGQRGWLADTFIVLVADHGESLGENGILHSHAGLFEPTVHVPMLLRWPDNWKHRRPAVDGPLDGLVQTLDLHPTLLRIAGLNPAEGIDGVDLYRLGAAGRPAVFMEHANGFGAAVRTRRFKYVDLRDHPRLGGPPQLYDLAADPGEAADARGTAAAEAARLAEVLRRWRQDTRGDAPTALPADVGQEDLDQLRALGYLR